MKSGPLFAPFHLSHNRGILNMKTLTVTAKEDKQEYTICITNESVTIKPSKCKCIPIKLNNTQSQNIILTIENCVEQLFKIANIK